MRGAISTLVVVGLMVGCGTRVQPTVGTPPPSPTATASAGSSASASPPPTASATPAASAATTSSPSPTAAPTPSASPPASPTSSPAAGLPQDGDPVTIEPANFTNVIDNPWWPMTVGSVWNYTETDAEGTVSKVEVTVTPDTKLIMGVATVVVHDVLKEDGQVVEDTFDWYAQDLDGNIWYFGEDTKEFADGAVDTTGSWEAGVDGALPGVIIPAAPGPV